MGPTLPSDQVIRGNPANRGTETSAEVLVGPPGRMVSNERRSTAVVRGRSPAPDGRRRTYVRSAAGPPRQGPLCPATALWPLLHPPPQSASEGIGGARGLGNLVRPESVCKYTVSDQVLSQGSGEKNRPGKPGLIQDGRMAKTKRCSKSESVRWTCPLAAAIFARLWISDWTLVSLVDSTL